MTVVHVSPALQRRSWGPAWQRVALHYRVRDYAAVMDAVCGVDSDNLAIERDDWMIAAQDVSQKEATLVALFLPHPEDMTFCAQSEQIMISPIQDLRSTARCLRQIVPNSSRAMVGRLILDLADESTLTMLQVMLGSPLDITPPIRHPVLLDVA